jgi:hypothetical protein
MPIFHRLYYELIYGGKAMILAAAVVIAVITTIVMVACYKATTISIDMKNFHIKDLDENTDKQINP